MIEEYKGDMILIDRLAEFIFPNNNVCMQWNDGENILLEDISAAIDCSHLEESTPFRDHWKHRVIESKSTEWHINRVIYFINHPNEIKNIEIDNLSNGMEIFPIPIIDDGNHRFLAAMYLHKKGQMDKIHCMYGGRQDLLAYLSGKIDEYPDDFERD